MNINEITTIIFDLGGVILNLDMKKTEIALGKILGITNPEDAAKPPFDKIFKDYETGNITTSNFLDELNNRAVMNVSPEEIINAWNVMLLDLPEKRIRILEKLSKHYKLFMLSNINDLHIEAFEKIVQNLKCNFFNIFEKVYYSNIIHQRKPDKEAYQIVIDENNLDVKTTFFVDDRAVNIKTAQDMGLQTLHITDDLDIADYFANWINN